MKKYVMNYGKKMNVVLTHKLYLVMTVTSTDMIVKFLSNSEQSDSSHDEDIN
jgi:hypothetical protein